MNRDADVIIIGAGAGGPVVAKELGEQGIKVLLLEAGPWYGNRKWPSPNTDPGGISSSDYEDLSSEILDRNFTDLEDDMNNFVTGKFRWGPANRDLPPWSRETLNKGLIWQNSGVGGSTLHYFANSPRAYPSAVDNIWPISYDELIPYYQKVETILPVYPAPATAKEDLFYYGAEKAGWEAINTFNVTRPGFRPQPNAILRPDPRLNDPNFDFALQESIGCTLRGHCVNGCHIGPTIESMAKRSTFASYIPSALQTGNVEVRPNTFVTKVLTEKGSNEGLRATGVLYRDTWTGETGELRAQVVVMAAGAIETPRLWLNSELPQNPWVGKGLVNHLFDCVSGIFDEKTLIDILGVPSIDPFIGQNSAARFDHPGLGVIQPFGLTPGLFSSMVYSTSDSGYNFLNTPRDDAPWDIEGLVVGQQLKEFMEDYPRTLSLLIFTDDEVNQNNGISLSNRRDENGFIPVISYRPSKKDIENRDRLAVIAADILRKAGAKKIIRSNWPPEIFIHIQSTMRIGLVTDTDCEAHQVKGLYIADNSIQYNGLGGPNPTLTTQALATRTSEKIIMKYFS
ncbi:choline dehydrogenase-like flavoprotein [Natranaerovirga pectinivora]|uniref:Choline dehydrogenase-like flavoprotein n=1 Tax=Natranaerovirga pectinivora TaxID=682400 RepID=A0A4R3MP92_9FIRM|nr:GMC family oxidoreductase [Natranaerovirga pectinivora]TCT16081.1 choline dehydrogenase-like flavoprotein [Natranaerovirga pectinivora]